MTHVAYYESMQKSNVGTAEIFSIRVLDLVY